LSQNKDERFVYLFGPHGNNLGNTYLYFDELLKGDDCLDNISFVRIFLTSTLRRTGCYDISLSNDDITEMINNRQISEDRIIITLPDKYSCLKHGFALSNT